MAPEPHERSASALFASGQRSLDEGPSDHVVFERLLREGHRFDFFQAVRLLEGGLPAMGGGENATRVQDLPFQIRPDTALAFPSADVREVELIEEPSDRSWIRMTVAFLGLYGVDAPLPLNFSEALVGERSEALRHFLDIFNDRLYALYYRAWKKYHPVLHIPAPQKETDVERSLFVPEGGADFSKKADVSSREKPGIEARRHARRFLALAGLGTPNALKEAPVPPLRLAGFAGHLAPRTRHAEGLRRLLKGTFRSISVEVIENLPRRIPLRERPALGGRPGERRSSRGRRSFEGARLGVNTTVGETVRDVSGKFRVCLGPMDLDDYLALLPGGRLARKLRWLVRSYAPDHLDFDVELRLPTDQAEQAQLGIGDTRLGLSSFLGTPTGPLHRRVVRYG